MDESNERSGLRHPPVTAKGLGFWVGAIVIMIAISTCLGLLIVHALAGSVGEFDLRVARWFVRQRTPTWDDLSWLGSGSAEAVVKISATIVLGAFFVWRWRRWNEFALLAGSLVFEVTVFTATSFLVDRDRPPVPHLDTVPPTGSFPSGHTAAAVAFYGALAIIVWWHVRSPAVRGFALAVALVMPPIVATSRMYRGMHNLSDVAVGAVIGAIALWVTYRVVRVEPETALVEAPREEHDVALPAAV